MSTLTVLVRKMVERLGKKEMKREESARDDFVERVYWPTHGKSLRVRQAPI